MRFGVVHRVMTDALAALGVLAVVSTASMSPWTNGLLLVGLAASLAVPDRWQTLPAMGYFAKIAPVAIFVAQAARLVAGKSPLDVAVEFAALLQIVRLATRRGAVHDQQIIVLALLHFVAGTVLGGGLTYGICFLGFLVVAPGALVLSHLRREVEGNYRQGARDRTGLPVDVPRILRSRRVVGKGFLVSTCLLSIPIFFFTATLFVLFPRVGLSLLLLNHSRSGRMVGFSDHVDLGQVGVLRSDPSIAMRFEVAGLPDPPPQRLILRFRGTAFDTYNGHAWDRTLSTLSLAPHADGDPDSYPIARPFDVNRDTKISIDLEPIEPTVLFLPPRTVGVRLRPPQPVLLNENLTVQRGPEGDYHYLGAEGRGVRYEAYLASEREGIAEILRPDERARYLSVPALPQRIADLAHTWADQKPTATLKAKAIEEHLRKDFRYDTASPSGGKPQPVDDFLFESKRGHCEFFSTAMALMLRDVGIPSRNVTGFVGGTYNRFGHYYAVREGDAHSWVEAYIDDGDHPGWVTFDPTPPGGAQPLEATSGALVYVRDILEALSQRWNTYVINYNLGTQVRLLDDFHRRYEALRSKTGTNHGRLEKWTRPPLLAAAFLALTAALALLWKRFGRRSEPEDPTSAPPPGEHVAAATALYKLLEGALSAQGISRPTSLPPLRHAEDLVDRRHPLAAEVLDLTALYLDVRFGKGKLTDSDKHDFEKRVRDIRTAPPPQA